MSHMFNSDYSDCNCRISLPSAMLPSTRSGPVNHSE
jgi:hypothetical protein